MRKPNCKCGKKATFKVDCVIEEYRLIDNPMAYERLMRNLCEECYIKLKKVLTSEKKSD